MPNSATETSELPTRDPADSPFNRLIGLEIGEWREDCVVLTLALTGQHLNRSGVLHGGVLSTLIDVAGGLAGCHCTVAGNVRRALTLSMTVNFTDQTRAGQIRVVARKRAGGRKIFFAGVEVFDDRDTLIALGEVTCRYRSGSEAPEGMSAD